MPHLLCENIQSVGPAQRAYQTWTNQHDEQHVQREIDEKENDKNTNQTIYQYRVITICIVLDLSPSLFTVSPVHDQYDVLYGTLTNTLRITLQHLATSTYLQHSTLIISVIGCVAVDKINVHQNNDTSNDELKDPIHVLIHGAHLNINTLTDVLTHVIERLKEVERLQANEAQQQAISQGTNRSRRASKDVETSRLFTQDGDIADSFGDYTADDLLHSTSSNKQSSLNSLVDCGRFTLDRLDLSAAPSIILITDGCLSCPNVPSSTDSVFISGLKQDVRLNILQITPKGRSINDPISRSEYGSVSYFSYGYVPESSLLEFAARETGGVFYDREIIQNMRVCAETGVDTTSSNNQYVKSSLETSVFTRTSMIRCWIPQSMTHQTHSQLATLPVVELKRHKDSPPSISSNASRFHPSLLVEHSISPSLASLLPLICERIKRMIFNVDMARLIECRVREGFSLFLKPDEAFPQTTFVFRREWQPQVFIEYQVHLERTFKSEQCNSTNPTDLSIVVERPSTQESANVPLSWHSSAPVTATVELFVIGSRALLDSLYFYQHPDNRPHDAGPSDAPHIVLARILRQMFEVDVMLVHLARLASTTSMATDVLNQSANDLLRASTSHCDNDELAFTFAKSELMRCPLHSLSDLPSRQPVANFPSLPVNSCQPELPVTVSLPPIPSFVSSSYLSPSHELWQGLATMPQNLIACLFDCMSFDVICSLHRRAPLDADVELELELELEIDFASLARVRSSLNQSINPDSVSPFNTSHLHTPLDASFARAVSTVSLPRSMSTNPQTTDIMLNQSDNLGQQGVAETLCRLMQGWSSITVSNACFVHFPAPPSLSSPNVFIVPPVNDVPLSVAISSFAQCSNASLPFVLARLTWRTKYLVTITLAFHACDSITRSSVTHSLKTLIECAFVQTRQSADPLNKRDTELNDEEELLSTGSSTASFADSTHSNEGSIIKNDNQVKSEETTRRPSYQSTASYDSFESSNPQPTDASKQPVCNERLYPFGVIACSIHPVLLRPSFVLAASLMFEGFVSHFPHRQLIEPDMSTTPSDGQLVNPSHYHASRHQFALLRAFMRHRSWHWSMLSADQSMSQSSSQCTVSMKSATRLIRSARTEEGFVLGSSTGKSTTWIRFVSLKQPLSMVNDPVNRLSHACLLQYSITEIDNTHIETDLWMEPLYGKYSPPSPMARLHILDGYSAEDVSGEHLFNSLSAFIHACDLHIISAVSTFDQIRDLEYSPEIWNTVSARMQSNQLDHAVPAHSVHPPTSSGLALHLDDDWHAARSFSYELDNERRTQAGLSHADSTHSLSQSREGSRPTTPRSSVGTSVGSSFWNMMSPESHRRMAASQLPHVKHSVTHDDLPSMRSNLTRSVLGLLPTRSEVKALAPPNHNLLVPSRSNSQPHRQLTRTFRTRNSILTPEFIRSNPPEEECTEWNRVPLSLTYLLECGVATVFKFSLPLDQLPEESPIIDLSSVQAPISRVVSSPPISSLRVSTQSSTRLPPICSSTPSSPVHSMGSATPSLPSISVYMLRQLHVWLVESLRSLADIELIGDRCFAQLVNEYTCIVIVLPRRPSLNKQNFGRDSVDQSAQDRAACRKASTGPITTVADSETDDNCDVDDALDELLNLHGCQLSIVDHEAVTLQAVFVECSRDNLGHPRAKTTASTEPCVAADLRSQSLDELTDGRSDRQFRSAADKEKHIARMQLVRSLFASPVLAHDPPVVNHIVNRAVALALGLANVVQQHAPASPALTAFTPSPTHVLDNPAFLSPSYMGHTMSEPPLFTLDAARTPPTRSLTQGQSVERLPVSMTLQSLSSAPPVEGPQVAEHLNTSFTQSTSAEMGSPVFASALSQQQSVQAHMRRFIHDVFVMWIGIIKQNGGGKSTNCWKEAD